MKSNDSLEKIEKILKFAFMCFLLLTIISNVSILYNNSQNTVYQSSTDDDSLQPLSAPTGTMVLALEGDGLYPQLEVLVNGEPYKPFQNNKQLEIQVSDRDVVEVKGTMYQEKIAIQVIDISKELNTTYIKEQISVEKNIVLIGIARF